MLCQEAHEQGLRIVLTNGCFDILHVGHVRYLAAARSYGDLLIVGINDDASVRRLKGLGRPVNTARDRAEVVAALESVDYVTLFSEDTATELVEVVRPDAYVKGGDYSDDACAPNFPLEAHVVRRQGGLLHVLPLEDGYSTSRLLEVLRA